jgi:hypothetical protein
MVDHAAGTNQEAISGRVEPSQAQPATSDRSDKRDGLMKSSALRARNSENLSIGETGERRKAIRDKLCGREERSAMSMQNHRSSFCGMSAGEIRPPEVVRSKEQDASPPPQRHAKLRPHVLVKYKFCGLLRNDELFSPESLVRLPVRHASSCRADEDLAQIAV